MKKIKVAYVCVHNSCRSQIAEALTNLLYSDQLIAYSAGTVIVPKINQDAVRLIEKMYHINMEENQYSKLVDSLPPVDIVITMGCNVDCPYLPCQYREDWGLEDPSGKNDQAYLSTIQQIEMKLKDLSLRIKTGIINIH